jgi:hypothetical protein
VNEFQLFLIPSESSCKECIEIIHKECINKVQSLSLKAQQRYRCFHSSGSAGEAHKPCKVCAGWLKAHNLSTKG